MAGLGLRYCPNHPAEPLMLVSHRSGTFWRCEADGGCAHTENAVRTGNGVVAVNGRAVRMGGAKAGQRRGIAANGTHSKVERAAEEHFGEAVG